MKGISNKELEVLDRYILDEVDPGEREFVNDRLATSEVWQAEYQLRIAAKQGGQALFEERMRKRFREIDSGRFPGRHRSIMRWVTIAAGILLLIVAYFALRPQDWSERALASFSDFPNIVMPIQKSESDKDARTLAYQAYELQDYEKASILFSTLPQPETSDRVYYGLSELERGKFKKAKEILDAVVQSGDDTRWVQVADWYLVKVELSLGQQQLARQRIERIGATEGHRYQGQAKELL